MAKVFIEESTLTNIGNAIREKTGKSDLIDPALMSAEIASIEAGGGGDLPEEAFTFSGDLMYRFAEGTWDWFVELYGNRITTSNLTTLGSTFKNSKLERIPFVLNGKSLSNLAAAFTDMKNLKECPKVRGAVYPYSHNSIEIRPFSNNNCLRYVDDLFEDDYLSFFAQQKITSAYTCPKALNFYCLRSLRKLPSWWYQFRLNEESTAYPASSYCLYYNAFRLCVVLSEMPNMPVWRCKGAQTDNMFSSAFQGCGRAKTITFETNNGQPIETKWKSQTIDLTNEVGYSTEVNYATKYNSGITADKEVKGSTTYPILKDDLDWFTAKVEYSRYNHDSAVETINSLPDTSAYLATAGGTNTIKFKGASGSETDGGAINTLTAEEIAIATAKGWTVTLV